jgi:hypothetical protein
MLIKVLDPIVNAGDEHPRAFSDLGDRKPLLDDINDPVSFIDPGGYRLIAELHFEQFFLTLTKLPQEHLRGSCHDSST